MSQLKLGLHALLVTLSKYAEAAYISALRPSPSIVIEVPFGIFKLSPSFTHVSLLA